MIETKEAYRDENMSKTITDRFDYDADPVAFAELVYDRNV